MSILQKTMKPASETSSFAGFESNVNAQFLTLSAQRLKLMRSLPSEIVRYSTSPVFDIDHFPSLNKGNSGEESHWK